MKIEINSSFLGREPRDENWALDIIWPFPINDQIRLKPLQNVEYMRINLNSVKKLLKLYSAVEDMMQAGIMSTGNYSSNYEPIYERLKVLNGVTEPNKKNNSIVYAVPKELNGIRTRLK